MKKSLSIMLVFVLLVTAALLASCGSTEITTSENTEAMTITLYSITNKDTTQEQIDVVQEAINNIVESKYNTKVVLKLFTEDEYAKIVEANLKATHDKIAEEESRQASIEQAEKEARMRGEKFVLETEPVESEAPRPLGTYPDIEENQMDIFLVRSIEEYYKLVQAEDLAALDDALSGRSKLINSYIYPTMIRSAKTESGTFGIFNNNVLGSYQYLLLNKELVDKYEYDPETMKTIDSLSYYLQELKEKEPDVVPFAGDMEPSIVYYNGEKSLLGAYYPALLGSGKVDALTYLPEAITPKNVLYTTAFGTWLTKYNKLYQQGIFGDENAKKFGAKIIEGDVTLSPTYSDVYGNYKKDEFGFKYITIDGVDYYCSVYRRPLATNENVFHAGYVVSAQTQNVARCMEIITAFDTDATLANLMQYGVEGTHYIIDEDTGKIKSLNKGYSMDIKYAGNFYLLKQSLDMDEYWSFMSENEWLNAKNTNMESIYSPFLGYYFNPDKPVKEDLDEGVKFIDMTFEEVVSKVASLTCDYVDNIRKFTDTEAQTFDKYLAAQKTSSYNINEVFALCDAKGMYYMVSPYNVWYQDHYGVKLS